MKLIDVSPMFRGIGVTQADKQEPFRCLFGPDERGRMITVEDELFLHRHRIGGLIWFLDFDLQNIRATQVSYRTDIFAWAFHLQLEFSGNRDLDRLDVLVKTLDHHALAAGQRRERWERLWIALQRRACRAVGNLLSLRYLGKSVMRRRRSSLRLLCATVAQHRDQKDDCRL